MNPRTVRGMADLLLPFAVVDDGIVLQRDGSLLASWEFRGPDAIASSPDEIMAHAERANQAFQLGSSWMFQCDVIRSQTREYLPAASFPDPISELVDEERRQQFEQAGARFETEYFLTLTHLPPHQSEERLRGFVFDGAAARVGTAERTLDMFRERVEGFERLFGALVWLRRLKSRVVVDDLGYSWTADDLLQFLRRAIRGANHPFRQPGIPIQLNEILAVDLVTGIAPVVDGRHTRVVSIDGFPPMSLPGILRGLDMQAIEYRWSTRFQPLDGYEAQQLWGKIERRHAGVKRRGWDMLRKDPKGRGDAYAERLELEAYSAQGKAAEGRVQTAVYTSTLIAQSRDRVEADSIAKVLQKAVRASGFAARLEEINAVEALLGSFPGNGYANCRNVILNTLNVAHLLPLNADWRGERANPSGFLPGQPALMMAITNGSTPFHVNIHQGEVGHTLMLGPSGTGKTTLAGAVAVQALRYPGARVFCFDRGRGIWPATMMVGGEYYDIAAPGSTVCFAPLRHIDTEADAAWACEWVEALCELNKLELQPAQRNAIAEAIERLRGTPSRSLTDFSLTVQDARIREALQHYTLSGPLGFLFDAEGDVFASHGCHWAAFETEHLLGLSERAVIPALLYLFRRIEARLDGSPAFLVLDEAWSYLEHPIFQRKLADWLRTMRKRNACVILSTQQIGDISSSAIADVILDNCPTKFLLPNAEAANPVSADFYRRAGLNAQEITMLARSHPKKHYYLVTRTGRRLIDLDCGRVLLSVVGVEGAVERRALRELIDCGGPNWRAAWLRRRGVRDWADYLEEVESEEVLCAGS